MILEKGSGENEDKNNKNILLILGVSIGDFT
jgi:hypothetical protein